MNRPVYALLAAALLATTALAACGSGGAASGPDADGTDLDAGPTCSDCVTALPLDGACAPITLAGDGTLDWSDARCAPRQTRLVGAVARHFTYTTDGDTRTSTGVAGYDGMGYVVSHTEPVLFSNGTDGIASTVEVLLAGDHHLIRRITWTIAGATLGVTGNVRLVVDWFVATGRSHPVYAITYDLTGVAANALTGDSRAPYGELRFDGDRGGIVDGVGWGDSYRFVTLSEPLNKLNGWDYSAPNVVPYAMEWITDADAEMGLVQTEPQARRAAGGYWFYDRWGMRDDDGPMPEDFNWAYQLNQYSFTAGQTTDSTRLSWGLNYGAVGHTAYAELGDDPSNPPAGSPSGYPYQSYATAIVLGRHSAAAVLGAAGAIEVATTRTIVTATTGSVVTGGPAGVGRTDPQVYQPVGYDPLYAVWRLDAAAGAVVATFTVTGDQPLTSPTVAIHGAAASATVRLAGQLAVDGTDVYRSFDAATDTLWMTFPSAWRGSVTLALEP